MIRGFGSLVQPANAANSRYCMETPRWSGVCPSLLAGGSAAFPVMTDMTMRASSNAGLNVMWRAA